jgi:SAM-dependent methyltransferase
MRDKKASKGYEGTTLLDCPVCSTHAPRESGFDDVILHRCPVCGHCFTDVESLDYPGEYDEAWEALHANWFAHPNIALFEFVANTIEHHKDEAAVIDIGAGRGELLRYLGERKPQLQLTGLDLALEPTVSGVEVIRADINSFDFGERRWEVAVSLATIEHLADVQGFARRLRSMIIPGGLAIVSTNNERSIPYDVARAFHSAGYSVPFARLYDRHHLNHFNPKSLTVLMETNGFRRRQLWRHNIPIAAVDMPKDSAILKLGVWGTFAVGRLTGRTFFQTMVVENVDGPVGVTAGSD